MVEFRGEDEIGLLFRITSALERAGLDVRSARVSSVAGAVVDAFYVTDRRRQADPTRGTPRTGGRAARRLAALTKSVPVCAAPVSWPPAARHAGPSAAARPRSAAPGTGFRARETWR